MHMNVAFEGATPAYPIPPQLLQLPKVDLRVRPRSLEPELTTETVPLRDFEAYVTEWQDLADHAAETNHFYTPDYALAAARCLFPDRDIRALLVWRRTGLAGRQLVGLFPHEIVKRLGFSRWPIYQAWHHDHSSSTAPLIRRGLLDEVLEAFLGWLPESPDRPAACVFDEMALDHAVSARLLQLLEERGRPVVDRNAMLRPAIRTGPSSAAYLESRLSGRKRGDLRRMWRRLGERGALTFETVEDPERFDAAIEEFLALEAAGWKGAQSSAMGSSPETAAFARAAYGARRGSSRCRVDVLRLDGRPISLSVKLITGRTAWAFKTTYDESLAKYSPGALNDFQALISLLDDSDLDFVDSATLAPSHPVGHIWRERLLVGEIAFVSDPARDRRVLDGYVAASNVHDRARRIAKDIYHNVTGRR